MVPHPTERKHSQHLPNTAGAEKLRRCLVLGDSTPTDMLIRYVVGPDAALVADLAEKLPGRGLWLTASQQCVETALEKKLFSRAAKETVHAAPSLLADVTAQLEQRVLNLLGLAKKAGQLTMGADTTAEAAKKGILSYILMAADAGDNVDTHRTPTLRLPLNAAQLGAALGRDNAVYIGVSAGKGPESLIRDTKRLIGIVNKDLDE